MDIGSILNQAGGVSAIARELGVDDPPSRVAPERSFRTS